MISKLKNSIKFLIIKFYLKLRRILKKTFDKSSNTYFFLKKINYLILQFTIVGSIMEWFYQSRARDKKIFKIKLPKFKATDSEVESIIAETFNHTKPLWNALGDDWQSKLTPQKIAEIVGRMGV